MDAPAMALGSEWLSFHILYPTGNRDRLLTDLVRPAVRSLWQEGKLEDLVARCINAGPFTARNPKPQDCL